MTKKKTIYIPIEIKVREFIPRILFGIKAALKNYRIYIGSKKEIFKFISKKKNKGGVFFYKGGIDQNLKKLIRDKCNLYFLMDEEIVPNMQNYKKKMSRSDFFLYLIKSRLMSTIPDRYYSANKQINIYAKKLFKKNKNRCKAIGNIKIDGWRKENLNIYSDQVQEIKKRYKKFVIFNSDFRYIQNNFEFEDNFDKNIYKKLKFSKKFISKELDEIKDFAKFKNKNFKFLIEKLGQINFEDYDIKFLIRPHPTENISIWKKETSHLKNVVVCPPLDDVVPYIIASEGVMHNGCTTSNASIALNKPTAYFYKKSKDNFIVKEKLSYCYDVTDIKNFKFWLKNINKKKPLNNLNKKKFYDSISINKKSVSQLLIEDLNNFNIYKEKQIEFEEHDNYFKKIIIEFLKFFNLKFKKFLLIKTINEDYLNKFSKGINLNEAREILNSLKLSKKMKGKIKIDRINNQLLKIEN